LAFLPPERGRRSVTATTAIDCPLCQTPAGLTTAQITHIRTRVAETKTFRAAEVEASKALEQLRASTRSLLADLLAARPAFLALAAR
jgi:hypothetical protein